MFVEKYDDLENGKILKMVVAMYNEDKTQRNYLDALTCLRDSYVFIPCSRNVSSTDSEIQHKPCVIKNGEDRYIPIFSSEEDVDKEYKEKFNIVEVSFLEVISLAENDKNMMGIVLNPYTQSYVISAKMYVIAKNILPREERYKK